jgi:prevent-host-death family protein
MESVGAYEAKTHLPQLLGRVERGEAFTITRHGKPVARLVPLAPAASRPELEAAIAAMRSFQQQDAPTLGDDLSIRELIDEGRRS